jgi:tetratricopeptide (TPR) repeat protein
MPEAGNTSDPPPKHPGLAATRNRPPAAAILPVVLIVAALSINCHPPLGLHLSILAPRLPAELAAHLEVDDSAAFRHYARGTGKTTLYRAIASLEAAPPADSEAFESVERRLAPYVDRMLQTLADEFGETDPARRVARFRALPPDERRRVVAIARRHLEFLDDDTAPLAERRERHARLIEEALPRAAYIDMGSLYGHLAELHGKAADDSAMADCLRQAIDASLAYGDTVAACQYLGMYGQSRFVAGDSLGGEEAWERGRVLARMDGNWHEARLLSFQSNRYIAKGQYDQALRMLRQAESISRNLGDDQPEIRFLLARLHHFKNLGCWDIVERDLARGNVLLRRNSRTWSREEARSFRASLDALGMRIQSAHGRHREAVRLARRVLDNVPADFESNDEASKRYEAALTLAEAGRIDQAIPVLDRLVAHADSIRLWSAFSVAVLTRTAMALEIGDTTRAARLLDRYRAAIKPDADGSTRWLRHDALAARLRWLQDDRAGALELARRSLERFRSRRLRMGLAPEAMLGRSRIEDHRNLVHDLVADDAVAGYLFELAWPWLPHPGRGGVPSPTPDEVCRLAMSGPLPPLAPLPAGTIHCVYRVTGTSVTRWTREGDRVTRHDIAIETGIEADARHVSRWLETGQPAGPPDRSTAAALRRLSAALLPRGTGEDSRRLLVTRDGLLAGLPFEVLDIGSDAYRPLLSGREVAYASGVGADPHRPEAAAAPGSPPERIPALVVAAPAYPDDAMRRWSILGESLPHGLEESVALAGQYAGSRLLTGIEADRPHLLAAWEGADRLHLALHAVGDPELTYVRLLPLAGADDDGRLAVADVLAADLTGCRLAVLAGCATGRRYRSDRVELPSLGDAFRAAGAGAVVATGWNVRDADAAALVREFDREWAGSEADAVAALGRARRTLMARGVSPAAWAAWSILVPAPAAWHPPAPDASR